MKTTPILARALFRMHMKTTPILALFLALFLAGCAAAPDPIDEAAAEVRTIYVAGIAELTGAVERLESDVAALGIDATDGADGDDGDEGTGSTDAAAVRHSFEAARDAWKRVEYLVEYYAPTAADEINGPAIDEIEPFDPNRLLIPAEGFQVIEELLYPTLDEAAYEELTIETRRLTAIVRRIEQYAGATPFSSDNIWEAARLQLLRITALGITGFDSPIALRSIAEAATAVAGMRAGLEPFLPILRGRDTAIAAALDERLHEMEIALRQHPSFDAFDRLGFIRLHIHPTLRALIDARQVLNIPVPVGTRAVRADARSFFEPDAFDASFFAAPGTPPVTPEMVALGERLFFEHALSDDGTRSCAVCHQPERAFTDGLPRSRPLAGSPGAVLRNAPTILNAGLQVGSFYDLRTQFLEEQVADVVQNRDEMHGDLAAAANTVRGMPVYEPLIENAIGGDATFDEMHIRRALAAYMRSLVSLDSRVDRYLRGEDVVLSSEEALGFNLFMGRAKCGTCHFAPLFNGTVPPAYTKSEIEIIGVPAAPDGAPDAAPDPAPDAAPGAAVIDADSGAWHVLGNPLHVHGFRTPGVRNSALTAPYMHNGVYETLEEAVDFYNAGGGAGLGIRLEHQTLPADSLKLTVEEKQALVRFLEALTDTARTPPTARTL